MAEANLKNDKQYISVDHAVEMELTIKRSRFIASLRHVCTHAEFETEIKEIAKLYPKASHYCWAYRIGVHPVQEHASDAGEPSGSAGRPILGALKKHELKNIMAVVTRYYGGVKLGVRGLISAYGDVVLLAIEKAKLNVYEPVSQLRFRISYDLYQIFLVRLERLNVDLSTMNAKFETDISGEISIKHSILPLLLPMLESLMQGKQTFAYTIDDSD